MSDDNEQLRAKSARVTAERDEARAELLRRTAECDEVRARARELRREVEALKAERDTLRTAILDLEREDHSVHCEECDGREHVAGDSCGSDGEGGWTCCEGLSEEECVAAERSRCSCGLVAWRDRMRSAADLARSVRGAEDWRARALFAEAERDAARAEVDAAKATNRSLHALLTGDHVALGEALGRGPQDIDQATEAARELRAERDALRAIVEGRPTAPTREEIAAHRKAIRKASTPGAEAWWLVIDEDGHVDALTTHLAVLQRRWQRGRGVAVPVRWWPLDADGRPCAWPEVPRG